MIYIYDIYIYIYMGGFPNSRGTTLGVPIIRTGIIWGIYRGALMLGNDHILHQHIYNVHEDMYVWV